MRDLFDDPIPDIPYYRCERADGPGQHPDGDKPLGV